VSHIPQRKEKDCLNCGTIVQGRYCQNCGQENVVPKETFWHMVTHFFYDITHFDTNFFHTIHHLVLKPGFLSKEYMSGKRASYLHPVKMYVFTSAIFFLLFFSFFTPETKITDYKRPLSTAERSNFIKTLERRIKKDSSDTEVKKLLQAVKDSIYTPTVKDQNEYSENPDVISLTGKHYRSIEEYDSIENSLPKEERDGWLLKKLQKKAIAISIKYRNEPDLAEKKLGENILHRLPYMLFVSLPLFALILRLVYIRRKQFYFADHGVFTIHLYVFSFLVLLAIFSLTALQDATGWKWLGFIYFALIVWLFVYLFLAMRRFYGQRKGKTFLKFILVALLSLIMMFILFLFFILFSTFTL
jgi:hypothetical protein